MDIKEFKKTTNGYNDPRLKNIAWDMWHDPTEPNVLGWFVRKEDGEINLIPIPHDEKILGTMRPPRTIRLINLPIGLSGYGDAQDCKRETLTGHITFPLRIHLEHNGLILENNGLITLMDFFKAIYDFYHFRITHNEYKQLLGFTKKKDRESFFLQLKDGSIERNIVEEKKFLREWWAGSMYFEGYNPSGRTIWYGT